MNKDTQLQVQAYLDNELPPGQARKVAEVISSHPEARAIYDELKDTKEILATTGELPLKLQEKREFYWSQIQRRIQAEEASSRPAPASRWWLRLAVPVAGAMALFAVLLSLSDLNPRQNPAVETVADNQAASIPPFHQVESAPDVSTITFRSESAGITLVWVDTR